MNQFRGNFTLYIINGRNYFKVVIIFIKSKKETKNQSKKEVAEMLLLLSK